MYVIVDTGPSPYAKAANEGGSPRPGSPIPVNLSVLLNGVELDRQYYLRFA